MQRVIALNGVPESESARPPRPKSGEVDLSRTVHEWRFEQPVPSPEASAPKSEANAEPHWATHSSISLVSLEEPQPQLPVRFLNANIEDAVTRQYNPTTEPLPLATSTADLASLDRALESAGVLEEHDLGVTHYRPLPEPIPAEATPQRQPQPQPQMLLIPVSIVWAVTAVFSLCALALTGLVIWLVLRG